MEKSNSQLIIFLYVIPIFFIIAGFIRLFIGDSCGVNSNTTCSLKNSLLILFIGLVGLLLLLIIDILNKMISEKKR